MKDICSKRGIIESFSVNTTLNKGFIDATGPASSYMFNVNYRKSEQGVKYV